MGDCKHKYVYRGQESHYRFDGRNSREYYKADYYFCERCLAEKIIEKRHFCFDSELWNLPEWAKSVKTRVD